MGESLRFVHFSCIPPIHGLVNVLLKVLVTNVMVATRNHPTEMTPKTLNGVGEYVPNRVLFSTVINDVMTVANLL